MAHRFVFGERPRESRARSRAFPRRVAGAVASGPAIRVAGTVAATGAAVCAAQAWTGSPIAGLVVAAGAAGLTALFLSRRHEGEQALLERVIDAVESLDPGPLEVSDPSEQAAFVERWNAVWPSKCAAALDAFALARTTSSLPERLGPTFQSIEAATSSQEEAVEETASLVANMRQSMATIAERVELLRHSSNESASAILEMGSSIDEVATNTASLHEIVEASTSSVHQMGASIRQVSAGADQVQQMAESTAASVIEMDRSVQEVSSHAIEAASLTEHAHAGAVAGTAAVQATIRDIEEISSLTTQAKERLSGLVTGISRIGSILSAIDEINDETNLLSLNAAIIAAQAGEQGKAFLVVANHVKTLARRTASSTQDIEALINDIEFESGGAVRAMEAGIKAVAAGVERSRDAGTALSEIQAACRDASERVGEIARATSEQSRNSKGVAEATQQTSTQIQQISEAIAEQRRASEAMLESAENALASCRLVHRSTEEQRQTSAHITAAIEEITEMIRTIGEQTAIHARASESVGESVMCLLANAQESGSSLTPIRSALVDLVQLSGRIELPEAPAPSGSDSREDDGQPGALG